MTCRFNYHPRLCHLSAILWHDLHYLSLERNRIEQQSNSSSFFPLASLSSKSQSHSQWAQLTSAIRNSKILFRFNTWKYPHTSAKQCYIWKLFNLAIWQSGKWMVEKLILASRFSHHKKFMQIFALISILNNQKTR